MALRSIAKGLVLGSVALVGSVFLLDSAGVQLVESSESEVALYVDKGLRGARRLQTSHKEQFNDGVNELGSDIQKGITNYKSHLSRQHNSGQNFFSRICNGIKNFFTGIVNGIVRLVRGICNIIKTLFECFFKIMKWFYTHLLEFIYWLAFTFIVRPLHFIVRLCFLEWDGDAGDHKSMCQFLFVVSQIIFIFVYYTQVVRRYPYLMGPTPASAFLQRMLPPQAARSASVSNLFLSGCCWQARQAQTMDRTGTLQYWFAALAMFCCPFCTLVWANSCTNMNAKLGGYPPNFVSSILFPCCCPCCVIAQDAESLDQATGTVTRPCSVIYLNPGCAVPYGVPDYGGYGGGYDGYGNQFPVSVAPPMGSMAPMSPGGTLVPMSPGGYTGPLASGKLW